MSRDEQSASLSFGSKTRTFILTDILNEPDDSQSLIRQDEFSLLRNRLRVYAISDQDDTGEWIRQTYPDIVYIVSSHAWAIYPNAAWQGMGFSAMSGANNSIVGADWLAANIQSAGTLGDIYPDVAMSMEGDSPSWMWLIENGLGNRDHIEWGSWGGRYDTATIPHGIPRHYFDTVDRVYDNDGNFVFTNYATLWRWRQAYQEDFAARMQWSNTSDFTQVSHPAFIKVNGSEGPETMWISVPSNAERNEKIILDATQTIDTDNVDDNGDLEFQWYQYWDPTLHIQPYFPTTGGLTITPVGSTEPQNSTAWNDAGFSGIVKSQIVSVNATWIDVAAVADGDKSLPQLQHLILQVTNKRGNYPIRRYKRIVFELDPQN
ncbi:hypothetical protein KJ359_008687 [Pestalotiopsis sp. 9143b]|nr:hypothetical protein KJ359_008687 [Pestalotiopsis sp. 9143b]